MHSRSTPHWTRAKASTTSTTAAWSRQRLVAGLVIAATVAVVLLASLGYAVYLTFASATSASSSTSDAETGTQYLKGVKDPGSAAEVDAKGQAQRDAIAAAPMLVVSPEDMRPATVSTRQPGRIVIPNADRGGPAQVPTGFPHTPQGALGQLAEIDTTALESMDVATAADIYQGWSLPDGPGAEHWEISRDIVAFLSGAGETSSKDPATTVTADPAGALVKGVDGPDWTLACVQLRIRATITTDAQIGYGHCSRMQWSQGRWMIAPGKQPAPAPATWPGTTTSRRAGWLTWTTTSSQADQADQADQGPIS